VIEARALTKVYGGKAAVDGIDFQVKPGVVTGFLGPNGAGKSTTMRMILGLDLPTSGTVTVNGRCYQGMVWPLHEVSPRTGALGLVIYVVVLLAAAALTLRSRDA
jgi:ABC-2 type transport system ATP-binding protein